MCFQNKVIYQGCGDEIQEPAVLCRISCPRFMSGTKAVKEKCPKCIAEEAREFEESQRVEAQRLQRDDESMKG